jgi:hypothetical protein
VFGPPVFRHNLTILADHVARTRGTLRVSEPRSIAVGQDGALSEVVSFDPQGATFFEDERDMVGDVADGTGQ